MKKKVYIFFVEILVDNNNSDLYMLRKMNKQAFTMISDKKDRESNISIINNWCSMLYGKDYKILSFDELTKDFYNKYYTFCIKCLKSVFIEDKNIGVWTIKYYSEPQLNIVNYINDSDLFIYFITNNMYMDSNDLPAVKNKLEDIYFINNANINVFKKNSDTISMTDVLSILDLNKVKHNYAFVMDVTTITLSDIYELLDLTSKITNIKCYTYDKKTQDIKYVTLENGVITIRRKEGLL